MKNDLKIIHFNTQGFQSKVDNINRFVRVHKPDVLVVTEHFQKNKRDLEQIDGYRIVNSFCRKHNERGGVAIWAKDDIPCFPRQDLDRHRKEKELELVSVRVGEDVVVTGAYRPPSTSVPDFHDHLTRFIKTINQEPHVMHVLAGDFNIDNRKPNRTRTVLNEHDLMFHLTSGTHRAGSCIDNFITNFDTSKTRVIKSKSSEFSDHHPIELIIDKEATSIAKQPDSYLYKMYRTMFEKKTAELQKKSSSKQRKREKASEKEKKKSRPHAAYYETFSEALQKRTSLKMNTKKMKSKRSSERKSSNKSEKRVDQKLDLSEETEKPFFFLSWLYSWFISAPAESPKDSSGYSNKKQNKSFDSSTVLEVEQTSIFSKIFSFIFSVFNIFR